MALDGLLLILKWGWKRRSMSQWCMCDCARITKRPVNGRIKMLVKVKVKDGRCSPVLDTVYRIHFPWISVCVLIKCDMLVLWNPCCARWANFNADETVNSGLLIWGWFGLKQDWDQERRRQQMRNLLQDFHGVQQWGNRLNTDGCTLHTENIMQGRNHTL